MDGSYIGHALSDGCRTVTFQDFSPAMTGPSRVGDETVFETSQLGSSLCWRGSYVGTIAGDYIL